CEATINQYNVGLRLWWEYCSRDDVNVFTPSVSSVLSFLTFQFNKASFSSLNSYRAALSQILGPNLSKEFRIKRFYKDLSCLQPPLPKYNKTWDPTIVINHMKNISAKTLSLGYLTCKTTMLLAFATGQRHRQP
ncbi:hypothetical protein NQ314_017026, partial [Rhamnusium bicolor]